MSHRSILVAVISLSLFGLNCEQREEALLTPSEGGVLQKSGGGKTSLDLIENDYVNGLLAKDNANLYRQYAVSAPEKLPAKYVSGERGKDATYSMLQIAKEWSELSKSTQQEILDLRAKGFGNLKNTFETQHFVLHYTTQGNDGVPSQDNDHNGIPDYIDVAAQSWENVWSREVDQLNYPSPEGTPQEKFHAYYRDIPYYGYTVPTNVELLSTSPVPLGTASAYIVLENDFHGFPPNDEDVTGLETIRSGALKVTQAHEFMHACQFNINVYQSGWLMESHATWAEDAVYDNINDWHWYINTFLSTPDYPIFNRYVYGSAFFMNYLSETYGEDVTRQIWLAAKIHSTPDAVSIAAFGGSWEAMKAFAPSEYLLKISDFTTDGPSVIPTPHNYINATYGTYPVEGQVSASTNKLANRAPWGLGANFVEFVAGQTGTLTVTFDGMDGFTWRAYAVASPKNGNSPPTVFEIPLDSKSTGSLTISGFGTRWSKVTLAATIADRGGAEVPYAYSATVK